MEKKRKQNGFTLIEMLIVVFVVGVGLVGALSFFNVNLNNQFEAKNELIASGLAQESVDLVRNIADYNSLNESTGLKWYDNLCKQNCNANKTDNQCKNVDINSLSSHDCASSNTESYVCQDANSRYYQCNTSSQMFKRDIEIFGQDVDESGDIDLDSGDCFKVRAVVTWNDRTTEANDIICKPR
jgi:prepilin-type N-terminal cleavage/methylation domain-containing protein